jgi:hypothetical protein
MTPVDWRVTGSYFEVCNCDAICPCRRRGGQKLTSGSTYGVCEFALSWFVARGRCGAIGLDDRSVVLAGRYRDDEPGKPWTVCLYVDDRATQPEHDALADIFLGRLGGTALGNFAKAIGEVTAIRKAAIQLDHRRGRWFMRAGTYVTAKAAASVPSDRPISCGIPGHDRRGEEVLADVMRVDDGAFSWDVHGRCGFASDFDYASDSEGR